MKAPKHRRPIGGAWMSLGQTVVEGKVFEGFLHRGLRLFVGSSVDQVENDELVYHISVITADQARASDDLARVALAAFRLGNATEDHPPAAGRPAAAFRHFWQPCMPQPS